MANPYSFITRALPPYAKGTKLTFYEMDNNLLFLSQSCADINLQFTGLATTGSNTFSGNQVVNGNITGSNGLLTSLRIASVGEASVTLNAPLGSDSSVYFNSNGSPNYQLFSTINGSQFRLYDYNTSAIRLSVTNSDTILNGANVYLQTAGVSRIYAQGNRVRLDGVASVSGSLAITGSIVGPVVLSGSLAVSESVTAASFTGSLRSQGITYNVANLYQGGNNITVSNQDVIQVTTTSGTATVNLPASPKIGQKLTIAFLRNGGGAVTVNGNGNFIDVADQGPFSATTTSTSLTRGGSYAFTYMNNNSNDQWVLTDVAFTTPGFNSATTITGATTVAGSLTASGSAHRLVGATTITGSVSVSGSTHSVIGATSVTGATTIAGSVAVSGSAHTVIGATTITGSLSVSGSSHTLSGSVGMFGGLAVRGLADSNYVILDGTAGQQVGLSLRQSNSETARLYVDNGGFKIYDGSSFPLTLGGGISTLNGSTVVLQRSGTTNVFVGSSTGNTIIGNTTATGSFTVTGSLQVSGSSHRLLGSVSLSGSAHTITGSVGITGSLTLNGQAITAGASINTGSLGSTTITGSLLVSGSGLTVTGSVAATTYADIGYGALGINPNAPILFGSMISGSVWYSPDPFNFTDDQTGLGAFAYRNLSAPYNKEIVIVLDDSRVFDSGNALDFTRYADNGDFGYPYYYTSANNGAIVDKVHIINASNYQQYYNYRSGYSSTSNTSLLPGQAGTFNVTMYTGGGNDRAGFGAITTRYTNGQLARHATPSAKALLLDPLSSITNAPYSPFSSSYANKLPQGTVYFDSTLRTLGVATSNNVTSSVVLASHTGSVSISGSVTVTGTPTFKTPTSSPFVIIDAAGASSGVEYRVSTVPYYQAFSNSDGSSFNITNANGSITGLQFTPASYTLLSGFSNTYLAVNGINKVNVAAASTTMLTNTIVSASQVLTLQPFHPLPTTGVASGSFASSGSGANLKPYFWNGATWTPLF